jgi:hypothetical protein
VHDARPCLGREYVVYLPLSEAKTRHLLLQVVVPATEGCCTLLGKVIEPGHTVVNDVINQC